MAGIVRGIREVRQDTVSVDGHGVAVLRGEHLGLRRGPIITRQERVCIDVPRESIARTVGRRIHYLAKHTGAGPCGTHARCTRRTRLLWSVLHLIEPLQAYYASYVPPIRLGAKSIPRGRRSA